MTTNSRVYASISPQVFNSKSKLLKNRLNRLQPIDMAAGACSPVSALTIFQGNQENIVTRIQNIKESSFSCRWFTSLKRSTREPWPASWNSYQTSLSPCSLLWTTGCHGLTFSSPTVPKTLVPVRATTPTPCSSVVSPTGRPTATLLKGECLYSKVDAWNHLSNQADSFLPCCPVNLPRRWVKREKSSQRRRASS